MKLNKKDLKYLLECGYELEDFEQIEAALNANITKYSINDVPISRDEVIELIGREQFLASLGRSAFHRTAARKTEDGREIIFDSHRLFQNRRIK